MIECYGVGFTEVVRCDMEEGYKLAHGWTTSTGQGGSFPCTPPTGWKYDTRYSDIRDPILGTHGGCPNCIMTLIHLITIDPEPITDPCEGVICDPECFGDDRYSTTCDEGVCVKGILLDTDVPECGYIPPEPITDPKTSWMLIIIIIAIVIAWLSDIFG